MKSYKQMAEEVFMYRDKYREEKRQREKAVIKVGSSLCCLCFAALLGIGLWESGLLGQNPTHPLGDNTGSGWKDTTTQTAGDKSNTAMNPDKNNSTLDDTMTIISSYGGNASAASYTSPENGKYSYTIPLRDSIKKYGDDVLYHVMVDIFKDKHTIDSDITIKEEIDRLIKLSYSPVLKSYTSTDPRGGTYYYFSIYATKDQLLNFPASKAYGYFFRLYDEW
jgi:hypothetical protein